MEAGQLPYVLEAYQNSDFGDNFDFFTGTTATPESLTDCTAVLSLVPVAGSISKTPIYWTTENGFLTINDNRLFFFAPKASMGGYAVAVYELQLRLTHPGGFEETVFTGFVRINRGAGR